MTPALRPADRAKMAAAERACDLVQTGMRLGLGTGSTAACMLERLGRRVRDEGLRVSGVPTSRRTAELARKAGISVVSLDDTPRLDLAIDGADEVDGKLNLIKGGGGALLHEKIVAAASERLVVIADASKAVDRLGAFPLPVEVVEFGAPASRGAVCRVLEDHGLRDRRTAWRQIDGEVFRTEERNLILDCHLGAIDSPADLAAALLAIPGVVETGLFLGMARGVVLGHEDGRIEVRGDVG